MSSRLIKIITLLSIFLLALFTRFYSLSSFPPALFSDEVDAGYQADTFNKYGTDYFGNKFPVHFHSFSDWRTSAYIYSISFVKTVVNDPDLSVRLPSALFSLLSVFVFYLITKSKTSFFLLALSPWSIHYGRTGFEVSGMLLSFLLGIYFLQNRRFFLSVFFLALTTYFYSTAKLFLLLLLPIILLVWRQQIFKLSVKKLILLSLFAGILLTPMLVDTLKGNSGFRFSYISIFTEPHREQVTDTLRYQDVLLNHSGEIGVKTPFLSYIFHSKYQLVMQKFISNYLSSFSTNFLFLTGDANIRHGFGDHGLMYVLDFLTILFGIYLWSKKTDQIGTFFLLLLLISPIPFALTRDSASPHATRLILMLPSLIYFATFTLRKYKILLPVYLILFTGFWHYYLVHYPQLSARTWHTGMKQAVLATSDFQDKPIYFSSNPESFLPFFLYYTDYPMPLNLDKVDNSTFSGQTLKHLYFFGNFQSSDLSLLKPGSVVVVSKTEYLSQKYSTLKVFGIIPKTYTEQEEFYILTKDEI